MLSEEIESMGPKDIKEIVLSMKESSEGVYRLLENLLEWSRIRLGKVNFIIEKINLKARISECVELLGALSRNKGIMITVNVADELIVFTDRNMLDTILRNLISNAIKFTPSGGTIVVKSERKTDGSVEIKVIDSGIGMNEEMINNLFLLTSNTGRKGTAGETSSGLGLLLCKEFLDINGGKIWVESEVGKGSTFFFTVPEHETLNAKR